MPERTMGVVQDLVLISAAVRLLKPQPKIFIISEHQDTDARVDSFRASQYITL